MATGPHLLQLEFDHRVRLLLVSGSDRRRIVGTQVPEGHGLSEPVPFQNPIFDAALLRCRPVLIGDVPLQLLSERLGMPLM